MSTLITGATGALGRSTIDSLLARGVDGADIIATGRNPAALTPYAERGIRTARIDYDEPGTISAALRTAGDVERLLLISGGLGGNRVAQHRAVVEAAASAGVRRLVYTSTLPNLILSPDHAATEALIEQVGVPATILRNGYYAENMLMSLESVRATGTYVTSAGRGGIAFAARDDLARAAARVLSEDEHTGTTYTLTGDTSWDADGVAAAFTTVLGTSVAAVRLSPEEHLAALTGAGVDEGLAQYLVAFDGNVRDGLLEPHPDHDLSRLLERPAMSLRDALGRALAV